MADPDDLSRTLFGRLQALGHIRLARGVVGKSSVVAGIALLVLGAAVAMRLDVVPLAMIVGAVLAVFATYLIAVLWFAHKHPEQALLEGAEILQYRAQELAGRGVSDRPELRRTPTLPPPDSEE